MARNRSNKLIEIVTYIFVALLLVALIGVIVYFTNGLTTDFVSFYLQKDGADILHDTNGLYFSINQPLKIDVKYLLEFANEDLKGYSLELKANPDVDFDFYVDGAVMSFQGDVDWNKCFDIVEDETSFTVTPKGDNLTELLQCVYPGANIDIDENADLGKDLFRLTVYSYNKKASITLGLCLYVPAQGIVLDKTEIVF